VLKTGDGVAPKPQEFVVFNFLMKDSKDSVWQSTYEMGMPQFMRIDDTTRLKEEDKLVGLFRELSKGDSVRVNLTVKEFFNEYVKRPVPTHVDSTLNISYTFNVEAIKNADDAQAYQREVFEKRTKNQEIKDEKQIVDYLKEKNIQAERDSSGLYYVIHYSAGKDKPSVDNCVEVKYKGSLLKDGQVFDQNDHLSFPLRGVISGWQLGIPKLGIGDSATFYIPSGLAYGPQGSPPRIMPDAVLVFDVKLYSFGGEYDRKTQSCK
jgi:FKBP-type peptidyl-prolyl cis-trans isomerase